MSYFCSSLGPDRLISAAPIGAVSSIQSTAIVRICIAHFTLSSLAPLASAVSYAVEPISAYNNTILVLIPSLIINNITSFGTTCNTKDDLAALPGNI